MIMAAAGGPGATPPSWENEIGQSKEKGEHSRSINDAIDLHRWRVKLVCKHPSAVLNMIMPDLNQAC